MTLDLGDACGGNSGGNRFEGTAVSGKSEERRKKRWMHSMCFSSKLDLLG